MLRNSDLMAYDYKVHKPLVKTLLAYSDLYGKDLSDFRKDHGTLKRFAALHEDVAGHCKQFGKGSDTLVGKIIMGTLGIAPARHVDSCGGFHTSLRAVVVHRAGQFQIKQTGLCRAAALKMHFEQCAVVPKHNTIHLYEKVKSISK